jgi:capsular polysaccharide export protein
LKFQQATSGWLYREVLRHPLLATFLHHNISDAKEIHVGWGYRPSGRAALRSAKKNGNPLLLIEDSLVRSMRPGKNETVYGVLADSCGIHYDTNEESDLLKTLNTGSPTGWMRREKMETAALIALMTRFREIGVSKYNWFPSEFNKTPASYKPGILIVDQTRNDASIRYSRDAEMNFEHMLKVAFDSCLGAPIYLRAHPDHLYRSKTSCFNSKLLNDSRIHLIAPDLSPMQCFSFCHTVLVGSSLMGMEALIHGKKVITFGYPFFSGRGLTEDYSPLIASTTRRAVSLLELFEAAYLQYCHYFDPDTAEPCQLDQILDHIELQKEMFRKNSGRSVTIGFSPWKREITPAYLRSPAGHLSHTNNITDIPKNTRVLVWGRKTELPIKLHDQAVWVEDGFIRSKGLGAAFNFPYSWVLDETGIYFDSSCPSDLENLYNNGFVANDLTKAQELIQLLCSNRLTKYNLDTVQITLDKKLTYNRKIILIPGQVESDASILYGSPIVKTNLQLLEEVRKAEPDAYLIFKAHPDIVARTRHGHILTQEIEALADLIITNGNVLDWFDVCDEVHTMSSTVGFEALIRNVTVVTYGMPFYAGWGLTTDRLTNERRKLKLTLEELVCGALIKYPRYLNPDTGEFTTAFKVVRLLSSNNAALDRRAWYLKAMSLLKKIWVEIARLSPSA